MIPLHNNETSSRQPHTAPLTISLKTAFFIVTALTFVCFVPDLKNALLDWDDKGYILNNVMIRTLSPETVRWAFTEFYCRYWAPLTWLSYAVDYAFTGLSPAGFHLTNNILHAANAGLFFLLSHQLLNWQHVIPGAERQSFSRVQSDTSSLSCAMLAALLFSLHPLRVESVVWAAERKDVLSLFFGLVALLAYLQHAQAAGGQRFSKTGMFSFATSPYYWFAAVFYALSLLSKPTMFSTLPVMMMVVDWFPLGRLNRRCFVSIIVEKLPLCMLAVSASYISVQASFETIKTLSEINFVSRILIAFKSLTAYLVLFVWPLNISPVYYHPGNVKADFGALLSIVLILAISAGAVASVKRQPSILAGWLLFLIPLFPVIGIIQNGPQEMAARFTYLPSLSLSLVVAGSIFFVMNRYAESHIKRVVIWGATGVILVFFTCVTVRDTGFWKDDIALWTRVIETQPHQFGKAYYQRSLFLNLAGEYQKALSDVNEALTIASRKKYGQIHEIYSQRGYIRKNMKDYNGAIDDFSSALAAADPLAKRKYYLERGELYRLIGNNERAVADAAAASPLAGVITD